MEPAAKCKRCGQCCINLTEHGRFVLPVSRVDAKNIRALPLFKEYQKAGKIAIKKGEYDPLYPYDLVANGLCPFYDSEAKFCRIYDQYRPTTCVKFQCPD